MTTKWTTNISKWKTGIGHAIAKNREIHHARELQRVRRVLAAFLRKCDERRMGLRDVAADLDIGEVSVVDYVETLLRHAYNREEFSLLGLPCVWFGDDEGWVRVTQSDDECPNCNDRTLEDSRCVRCGYEDMPF